MSDFLAPNPNRRLAQEDEQIEDAHVTEAFDQLAWAEKISNNPRRFRLRRWHLIVAVGGFTGLPYLILLITG